MTVGLLMVLAAILRGTPACLAQQWVPPIQKVPHLFVQTEVLGVRGGVTRSLGTGTIEASLERPGTLSLPIELGPDAADHPTSIEIEITQTPAADPKLGLTIVTTVSVRRRTGDVARIRRERVAQVDEGRSFFHQAYENAAAGTSVLLTLTPDSRIVPVLMKPQISAPVVFKVTLSRVTESGDVALEDNELRTMEGSAVSYAFRIAVGALPPVEAASPPDSASVPETTPGADRPPEPSDTVTKPEKSKKKSKKERERELLEQYRRSREQSAGASGAAPAASSPPSDPDEAAADSGAVPTPAGDAAPAAPAAAPRADELELTLLPHRVESGILMVEATLRGLDAGVGGGAERATIVRETHAVTPNGTFDITVSGKGPGGAGSYRFLVQAAF